MKIIKFNKNLILIFFILFFILNIYFLRKADLLAQQGALLKAQEAALNFLGMGLSVEQVIKGTGLDRRMVLKLKKEMDSKTQH